jgi:hypothetical protein
MPPQKPVAEAEEARALAWRTVDMKVMIQPPRETLFCLALSEMEIGRGREVTFSAHVAEDEEGEEPGYFVFERSSRAPCFCGGRLRVLCLIDGTSLGPEGVS